ncbi:hypothetical protein RB195_013917 [Necator americanus]|uniref:Uncharacterized protein n=1 Tax=Necator americanus TaxID=51031 RepID=A0ABR1DYB7_NECAM
MLPLDELGWLPGSDVGSVQDRQTALYLAALITQPPSQTFLLAEFTSSAGNTYRIGYCLRRVLNASSESASFTLFLVRNPILINTRRIAEYEAEKNWAVVGIECDVPDSSRFSDI